MIPSKAMSIDAKKLKLAVSETGIENVARVVGLSGHRRVGRSHKFLCEFHSEKTPSMDLAVGRQHGDITFKCFGCGASGDLIALFTETKGLDHLKLPERLEAMAAAFGISASSVSSDPRERARSTPAARVAPAKADAPAKYERPAAGEMAKLWDASVPVKQARPELLEKLAARYLPAYRFLPDCDHLRIADEGTGRRAGVDPEAWRGDANPYLIAKMFDERGEWVQVQGRNLNATSRSNRFITMNGQSESTFFADRVGREVLSGRVRADRVGLWITEGLTCTASEMAHIERDHTPDSPMVRNLHGFTLGVVGYHNGSRSGIASIEWPKSVRDFYIATDVDEVGEKYFEQIREHLPRGSRVARVKIKYLEELREEEERIQA